MIDLTRYTWLDTSKKYTVHKEEQTKRVLCALDKKKNMAAAKKNVLAQYYFYRMNDDAFEVETDVNKAIKHWQKSKRFHNMRIQYVKDEEAQYTMTGIVMVISGTLFIYFLSAVLRQKFVVHFSIDAIVGAVALVLFIRNALLKYRLVRRYTSDRIYLHMDILVIVLCILIKIAIPPNFDFSLILFFTDYIFTKRRFHRLLQDFSNQ